MFLKFPFSSLPHELSKNTHSLNTHMHRHKYPYLFFEILLELNCLGPSDFRLFLYSGYEQNSKLSSQLYGNDYEEAKGQNKKKKRRKRKNKRLAYTANGSVKIYNYFAKLWQFLLNYMPLYNPPFPLLSIYPKEIKTNVHIKTCIRVFTVA